MTEPTKIDPDAWYDDASLYFELGLSHGSIARGRKCGRLRSTRVGARTLYLGSWVQAWLTGEPAKAEAVAV